MKSIIMTGALLAGLAVMLGAFGAHALKAKVSPENLTIFDTAVKYHMYHALGLILIGLLGFHFPVKSIQIPAYLMMGGILIFSGSLYVLVLSGIRWLGAITPIGGIAFIISWLLLAFNLYRSG
ncbi:MAG: DUF423 domain-containing protein [Candidatus Marinimicrobia bacterium]|nr:DUF423 domain-containing protein [Candidatus Neomarinimicrobiota bacterium]